MLIRLSKMVNPSIIKVKIKFTVFVVVLKLSTVSVDPEQTTDVLYVLIKRPNKD